MGEDREKEADIISAGGWGGGGENSNTFLNGFRVSPALLSDRGNMKANKPE
jgi:hypothetical protein